jgi:hypothetical protein
MSSPKTLKVVVEEAGVLLSLLLLDTVRFPEILGARRGSDIERNKFDVLEFRLRGVRPLAAMVKLATVATGSCVLVEWCGWTSDVVVCGGAWSLQFYSSQTLLACTAVVA